MNISSRCSLSRIRGRCICRCSSEDRTVPSTSSVTGSATKTDLGTCLANSGLVGEPLNKIHSNCWNSEKKTMISLMLHNQKTLTSSHLNKY